MMLLRASAAPRWMKCAFYAHFKPTRPEEDGDPAREGTCAAWVADMVINGDASSTEDMLGKTHENGWTVDEDMVRHTQWYVDAVMAREGTHKAEYYAKHPTLPMAGTMDHIGWRDNFSFLNIDDLKYGYRIINPQSWQLIAYLFLILSNMPPENWPRLIQLAILQPRAIHRDGPYRKQVVSIEEIQPQLNEMQRRVEAIMAGENRAVVGSHCYGCPAAYGCTALTQSVYEMWEPVQSREYLEPTANQLSEELIMLDHMEAIFKARFTAVKAEAETKMTMGEYIPQWGIEPKYGNKKFTVDPVSIQMITGVNPDDSGVCTPAELIRRGADPDVVKTITKSPYIGAKMVRVDDSSNAALVAAAKPKKEI